MSKHRKHLGSTTSKRMFTKHAMRVHRKNTPPLGMPMRGGIRL